MTLHIARVDYRNLHDAQALVMLLDAYARDPMGGGAGFVLTQQLLHKSGR